MTSDLPTIPASVLRRRNTSDSLSVYLYVCNIIVVSFMYNNFVYQCYVINFVLSYVSTYLKVKCGFYAELIFSLPIY